VVNGEGWVMLRGKGSDEEVRRVGIQTRMVGGGEPASESRGHKRGWGDAFRFTSRQERVEKARGSPAGALEETRLGQSGSECTGYTQRSLNL